MIIFLNFHIDLYFQGDLLQELDGQTQCEHPAENLLKIGWMVSDRKSVV